MPTVNEEDRAELEQCAGALGASGWAPFVTFDHLRSSWRRLAAEAYEYVATVDDYTNDLTSRTGLHLVQQCCSESVASRLVELLSPIDARFIRSTDADDVGVLGRYYSLSDDSGWWFRRIPKKGPLREYLADTEPAAGHEQ